MPTDTFAAFYARYVGHCHRAGVVPVTLDRVANGWPDGGAHAVTVIRYLPGDLEL